MEIEKLLDHLHISPSATGTTYVSFGGQNCLTISEGFDGYRWNVNPVFAKLTYGANVFSDVPFCFESYDSVESAIAEGISVLNDLNAFYGIVDIPDDTYAKSEDAEPVSESLADEYDYTDVLASILEDCRQEAELYESDLLKIHVLSNALFEDILDELYELHEAALSGDSYWKTKEAEQKEAKAKEERSKLGIKEPVKAGRGRPTNIDLEFVSARAKENIKAGKRPTAGMERNEKIHFVRHLAKHPDFADHHVSKAGRPDGTTNAAKAEKEDQKKKTIVNNPFAGLMR